MRIFTNYRLVQRYIYIRPIVVYMIGFVLELCNQQSDILGKTWQTGIPAQLECL